LKAYRSIQSKHGQSFWRNWNVPSVFFGKILMSRILCNLVGKIWIQNVGDIDFFKVISAAEKFK
jgi:hypothetical protein